LKFLLHKRLSGGEMITRQASDSTNPGSGKVLQLAPVPPGKVEFSDQMAEPIFDLEAAERLLPQLERLLPILIEAKKRVLEIESELARVVRDIMLRGGLRVDVAELSRQKQEKEQWTSRLRSAAQEIENCGCLLKDLDIGLIDFPSRIEGREMYLCWKLGEPSIRFWHYTDEGFAGRKPIDEKLIMQLKRQGPV
jgi:hypothetical protein